MKAARKLFFTLLSGSAMLYMSGCTDPGAVFDQNTPIDNHNWSYANSVKNTFKIDDQDSEFSFFFALIFSKLAHKQNIKSNLCYIANC